MNNLPGLCAVALFSCAALLACARHPESNGGAKLVVGSNLSAASLSSVTVTITGPGIPSATPITHTLVLTDGTWQGTITNIPAGLDTFAAAAYQTGVTGPVLTGSAQATVSAGTTALVTIMLSETGAPPPDNTNAPVIQSVTASTAAPTEGEAVSLAVVATDADSTQTLSYAWATNPTGIGQFDSASSRTPIWNAPSSAGPVALVITVSDQQGNSVSESFTLQVGPDLGAAGITIGFNPAPTVTALSVTPLPLAVGATAQVTVTVDDQYANGDTLSYAWSASGCSGTFSSPAANGSTSFKLGSLGSSSQCTLKVAVTDSDGSTASGSIVVSDGANPAPLFAPTITGGFASVAMLEGSDVVSLTIGALDPNTPAQTLAYAWSAPLGTFSSATNAATVSWTAPDCLPSTGAIITAKVTNTSGLSASQAFALPPATSAICPLFGPGIWNASAGTLSVARTDALTWSLPDGRVLVAGGDAVGSTTYATADLYNPTTDSFSPTANAMSVSRDTSSASTPLANGEVFIAGGYGSETTADLFNPSTNSFSSVGPLQTARLYASAALLQSGKVLLAGGVGSSGRITDVELYDPVAGTFTTVASLPNPYSQGSLTVLNDGRVLAAGGISNSGIANTAALYDPVANTWSGTGLMNHPRALHTAQLLADGTVFVAGGVDEENTLATAEIYNPATNQFTALSSQMSYPRRNFSSLTLPSGKILLPAGFDENDFGPSQLLTACDLFDPVSKTFSPTGAALVQRINYGLALLPNGHVLMAGGEGGSAAMATAEIYW